ncbi:hypothetical protein LDENG_00031610 [Lucifuga dentata]|nr:hypothetical protein LDENG_00031610 [Lucifuga dentata]
MRGCHRVVFERDHGGKKPGGLTRLQHSGQRIIGSSSLMGLRTYQTPASITHRTSPFPPNSTLFFILLHTRDVLAAIWLHFLLTPQGKVLGMHRKDNTSSPTTTGDHQKPRKWFEHQRSLRPRHDLYKNSPPYPGTGYP